MARLPRSAPDPGGEIVDLLRERIQHVESTPALPGDDLDADWQRASSTERRAAEREQA